MTNTPSKPESNPKTSSQLRRQKVAGYVLPMLVGWLTFILTVEVMGWVLRYVSNNAWLTVVVILCGVGLMPVTAHAMGIMNAYCWKNLRVDEAKIKDTLVLLFLYWFLPFLLSVIVAWPFSLLTLFPAIPVIFTPVLIHALCFWRGQERGKRWIETDALDKFLGRKNDWERSEPEQKD